MGRISGDFQNPKNLKPRTTREGYILGCSRFQNPGNPPNRLKQRLIQVLNFGSFANQAKSNSDTPILLNSTPMNPSEGPPGTSTAAQRPPGIHFGFFSGAFSTPKFYIFGAMLASFLASFPLVLSSPSFLASFHLFVLLRRSSSSVLPFLPPHETQTPRNQERKQQGN